MVSLLNPGVDPGPTHVHGITAEMLEDQPSFADIAGDLADLMHGRTLVAHNVGFDYSFLAAEAELAGTALPVDTVMCTVELSRRLDLGLENLRLESLARHWDIRKPAPTTRSTTHWCSPGAHSGAAAGTGARCGFRCGRWAGAAGPTARSPTRNCDR